MKREANIAVETRDIFPIIKKWLYSDHDVFVRELVSNAADALEKRKQVSGLPDQPKIEIKIDSAAKTLSFIDNGIGMDEQEVEKYLGQIAFSGASEFVKKLQDQNISAQNQLIGQFGLGFYSAFMVADLVEVFSRSTREGSKGVYWACKGEANYQIDESELAEAGTRIVLHLNETSLEYLEKSKLRGILKTYCNFMRYPVSLEGEVINTQEAIWAKRPAELKDEDYQALYRYLYPLEEDPHFWIHFNLDYPFDLQGILYFPKIQNFSDTRAGNVALYCKQVFVSDKVQDVVPEFLTLLKGVIDSPEIPLNVSRSALQGDPKIKMISEHIIKKVGDALASRHQNENEKFVKDWDDLSPFVKIGILQNEKFAEKAEKFLLYETSQAEFVTLEAYQEKYGEKLKDLNPDKKTFLYSQKETTAKNLLETLHGLGVAALFTDARLDLHLMQALEMRHREYQFARLDAELHKLLQPEKETELILGADKKTKSERLKDYFREYLSVKDLEVEVAAFKNETLPALLQSEEGGRRMAEMMEFYGKSEIDFPMKQKLLVNASHPLVHNLLAVADRPSRDQLLPLLCRQIYDLARLNVTELPKEERDEFLKRSVTLLQQLTM